MMVDHEVGALHARWNLYSDITPDEHPTGTQTDGSGNEEGLACLTKKEILERRIEMLDDLINSYTSEYWLLGEELLYLKSLGRTDEHAHGKGQAVRERYMSAVSSKEDCLPHAVRLQKFVHGLPEGTHGCSGPQELRQAKQEFLDATLKNIRRMEMSSHAALSREMNSHGALAMLCGMNKTYFIRSHIVSIGRNYRVSPQDEKIDIDISDEAALCGHERMISRLQAKIFKDTDGTFRIQNCSQNRPLSVDGLVLKEGNIGRLNNMSLISVVGVSLLFITHAQ